MWNKDKFPGVRAFTDKGFLCVEGTKKGNPEMITLVNVYQPQDVRESRVLWMDISNSMLNSSPLRCVMGELNSVPGPIKEWEACFPERDREL